jgi:hypothetical protein
MLRHYLNFAFCAFRITQSGELYELSLAFHVNENRSIKENLSDSFSTIVQGAAEKRAIIKQKFNPNAVFT